MCQNCEAGPITMEAPARTAAARRSLSIGLPKSENSAEKRFPLTPEAVGVLADRGFRVKMQSGASEYIHYSDDDYARMGADIVDRHEAMQCDIVIHLAPLKMRDIRLLRRGALLLSLANFNRPGATEAVGELLARRVVNIAVDLIRDSQGNLPFGDILSEIDGRSAMTIAASMLADPLNGKGILLGGIAGVIPCEVTIIGSCFAAVAAARSALGLGAFVRLFDDNVYRLRSALRQLGSGVMGSSIHPHVLENALRSADIVIVADHESRPFCISAEMERVMKRKALLFDLTGNAGSAFPNAKAVDLGETDGMGAPSATGFSLFNELADNGHRRRICFVNPGSTVPRTAAMALSDTFITLLGRLAGDDNLTGSLPLSQGLQDATLTFMGKAVNETVARLAGVRFTDIRILLSLSF